MDLIEIPKLYQDVLNLVRCKMERETGTLFVFEVKQFGRSGSVTLGDFEFREGEIEVYLTFSEKCPHLMFDELYGPTETSQEKWFKMYTYLAGKHSNINELFKKVEKLNGCDWIIESYVRVTEEGLIKLKHSQEEIEGVVGTWKYIV